ncbi:MAG: hypothetical protein ABI378_03850 [Chitinophagaceae bacterium]
MCTFREGKVELPQHGQTWMPAYKLGKHTVGFMDGEVAVHY